MGGARGRRIRALATQSADFGGDGWAPPDVEHVSCSHWAAAADLLGKQPIWGDGCGARGRRIRELVTHLFPF